MPAGGGSFILSLPTAAEFPFVVNVILFVLEVVDSAGSSWCFCPSWCPTFRSLDHMDHSDRFTFNTMIGLCTRRSACCCSS
jgi:hypothetical protein